MPRPAGTWMFVEVFFQGDVKEWSVGLWYDGAAAPLPPAYDANVTATAVDTALNAPILPALWNGVNYLGINVEVNFGMGTFSGQHYQLRAGTATGAGMPEDVCAVVRKNTAIGGASGTGRARFSGVADSSVTGSYLNLTGAARYATIGGAIITNIVDGPITWTPNLYSKKTNTLIPLVSFNGDALLGTARRRRPRF